MGRLQVGGADRQGSARARERSWRAWPRLWWAKPNSVVLAAAAVVAVSLPLNAGCTQARVGELREAYAKAKSEHDRTAVWLRAIDAGMIGAGRPVTVLDEILGTSQDGRGRWENPWEELDRANSRTRPVTWHVIDLLEGDQHEPSERDRRWYLMVSAYDDDGTIEWYELCNCAFSLQWQPVWRPGGLTLWWPGIEKPTPYVANDTVVEKAEQAPAEDLTSAYADLKNLYWAARTQYERRSVALRAIEGGLIKEGTPLVAVDQVFGTSWERGRQRGEEDTRSVEFLPYHQMPEPKSKTHHAAWYLGVLYDALGRVVCYSLSNVHLKG